MKIRLFYLCLLVAAFTSCNNKVAKQDSTIDSTLQKKCTDILKKGLNYYSAFSGSIIIIDVKTGMVKVCTGLKTDDYGKTYTPFDNYNIQEHSKLFGTLSLLAAIEKSKINMTDTIDTKNGLIVLNGDTIRDGNWIRGGYQVINLKEGYIYNSDISTATTVLKAFHCDKDYYDQLKRMSIVSTNRIQNSLPKYAIGYGDFSPMQIITYYNAIANDGIMVKPIFTKQNTIIINQKIASNKNIAIIKELLFLNVKKGMGLKAHSDIVDIAGKGGTIRLNKKITNMDTFCNQFYATLPAKHPEYSILVTLHKKGKPASGSCMAGPIAKTIAETIKYKFNN